MTEKFKVGDKVKGLGMTGVVIKSSSIDTLTGFTVRVRFNNFLEYSFSPDGRFFEKGEPCLELIERPRQKVTKTYYKAYYSYKDNKNAVHRSEWYDNITTLFEIYARMTVIKIEEKEFEIEE